MTYLPELLSNIDRPRPLANAKTSLPAPTGQLVVQPRPTPTGGMKPVAGTDVPINQKTLPGGTTATAKPGLGSRVLGGLVKGATVGALTTPNTMGDGTISGAIQRQREAGLSEEELISKFGKAAVSQATPLYFDPLPTAQDTSGESQMSRLGDEPMMFSAPTGPSSTATPAAPLAEVLPPEASLMGTESMPTPGVPTSTFDVNTRASDAPEGTVTMPTALADQTIQDSFAPVARNVNELASSGRAAYEGQSLSDFIGYRDKAQAATEQFVDAQGRLRRRDKATQSLADQYSGYEQQAAAREARMGEGSSFGQAVSDRERRGTMSMEDAVKLTRGNRPAAAAMLKRQELGMGEFKPKADTRTPEQVEAAQLANERTRQIIEAGKQPDATAALGAEKTQAQIDEIVARTKSRYGGEGKEVSSAEMKNTMQIIDDANIYYEPDTGKWMQKGGVWGKKGDKELDPNSEDYKKIAATKGGSLLLKDPDLLNPDAGANDAIIEKVMTANPGYSREEVIQALKDKGRI